MILRFLPAVIPAAIASYIVGMVIGFTVAPHENLADLNYAFRLCTHIGTLQYPNDTWRAAQSGVNTYYDVINGKALACEQGIAYQ